MIYILVFIFGAMIGSFLNVCIYRIPRKKSIISPGSKCTSCKKNILWYDNIPLLSYVLLKGKCRFCNKEISLQYFIVEAITALSFLILYMNFGTSYRFWIYSLVTSGLIVATFIDLKYQIIPDTITLGGMVLGVLLSIFIPELHYTFSWRYSLINSLSGLLVGGLLIYVIMTAGNIALFFLRRIGVSLRGNSYWRRKLKKYRHVEESMGFGDLKLMAMLGAFLGWRMVVFIFLLAPFFGAPVGLYLRFKEKINIIPYGPYISLAGFIAMIYGDRLLTYLF